MGTIMLEICRQERLLRLMEERGFTLCQQNGQRTYGGPPPNWGARPPPHRESEIFIGRLPRMCFEDELIPLFSSIGELYEFRLMLDFSGANRGFAYAHYATEESAVNAIKILHHYEIRPGHYIGVLRSKNNCRLLFSNIRQDTDTHTFSECIRTMTNDVMKVSIFANFEELKAAEMGLTLEVEEAFQEKMARYAPNSKFAIVEYHTHKAAAVARRVLIPKLGHMFAIDWAIPLKGKNQLDQGHDHLFENSSSPGNDLAKTRPVPSFNPRRSSLDGILYANGVYKNIAKYFRFLLNITLHRSMRKGDIPLGVYMEMEKKIIEKVKNIEHCGQATQLILNYLTWYGERMMMMIDPQSEKVLTELKFYSERMLKIASSRLICPNEIKSEMEEYVSNALPIHLNFCYYMAVFLSGDDRDKVCGLITDSLNWFEGIMQKARLGNESVTQFLMEISLLASEMDEDRNRMEVGTPVRGSRKRKTESSTSSCWKPFSGQGFTPIKKSTETMDFDTDSKNGSYSPRPGDSIHDSDNRVSPSVRKELLTPKFGCTTPIHQSSQSKLNTSDGVACLSSPDDGDFRSCQRIETFPGLDIESRKPQQLAILVPQPSITDFVSYMPKSYYNVVKYYKYLITANIQKRAERCEITLHMHREITTKVINNITNLELCVQGIGLIVDYLTANRGNRPGLVQSGDDLVAALHDVRVHATSLLNYVYSRGAYGSATGEHDEYYCRILPNQMSFLYHLTILLNGDERGPISGRLTDSIQWLNELVQKNRAGDVEVVEFFERISRIGTQIVEGNPIPAREVMKDVFDEFNNLLGTFSPR